MKLANSFFLLFLVAHLTARAQKTQHFQLRSPDGKIEMTVETAPFLRWSVKHEGTTVFLPSPISLSLQGGETWGKGSGFASAKTSSVNTALTATVYKKRTVDERYNQLQLSFRQSFGLIFRAYNDGVAYRFTSRRKDSLTITAEQASFNFDRDYNSFVPYIREPRYKNDPFQTSFESLYEEKKLSQLAADTLAFLPLLVQLNDNKKAVITEADLDDFPGLYLQLNKQTKMGFEAVHAPYPLTETLGGNVGGRNYIVTSRAPFLARTAGTRSFPWRAVIISAADKDLLNNDLVYKLAAPTKLNDVSWIKPGKVAWDWWNDWNISHVDFRAGINTPTYKYYIDFAAAQGLEYIVMDEGWSLNTDITQISPNIQLQEIVDYGKQKGVGVILWATWYAIYQRLDDALAKYAGMGVKGFKIDFLDRDDQKMVASTYKIAAKAAAHHLLIDLHGMYKPTGLQRTFPNVIGYEGVRGMENVKWAPGDNVPRYDVSLPFIRQVAGPMDYTPGAMRNATRESFRPVNSMPMSQGTRCHQLAMYIVYEAPLGMLSDNPTAYQHEKECTDFLARIPTSFDETQALDGQVGEYALLARRKGKDWYVGGMTNWTPRDITIDFSFLGEGAYEAEIFQDGINADRDATDYKTVHLPVKKGDTKIFRLMNGGGLAMRIYPKP